MIKNSGKKKLNQVSSIAFVGVVLALWGKSTLAQSQIIPDRTMGNENSQVRTNVNVQGLPSEVIEGGAQRGANLFHSFSEFNISEGRGAYFANPAGIEHILGRVTGANPSEILGTLGVLGNANLFLINPNGIIFGKNARLDVAGSFVGTTASAVQFGNQGFFSTTEPNAPPLLTVSPSAFFFNQIQPGRIENQSIASAGVNLSGEPLSGLRVPDGESLLLVGGDIDIDGGGLYALGGRVELGGLLETGSIDIDSNNLSLNFPVDVAKADISLTNGAKVDVTAAGGGNIIINSNNLGMSGASQILAGIGKKVGSAGSEAGDIEINATDEISLSEGSLIGNSVNRTGIGNAGEINIIATDLSLAGKSKISSTTFGQGDTDGIDITTNNLSLTEGSFMNANTFSEGNTGEITINAHESIDFDGINSGIFSLVFGTGNTSGINISTKILNLKQGSQINSTTFEAGNAGKITINATESISIEGNNEGNGFNRIVNDLQKPGTGNLGGIDINTANLKLKQNATISTSTFGEGNAGDININTSKLSLTEESTLRASTLGKGMGNGGDISINADSIVLDSDSDIESIVLSKAVGNSGNIDITTAKLSLKQGSQIINSLFGRGIAGEIKIIASESISISGKIPELNLRSGILSQVDENERFDINGDGVGNAGNIFISTPYLSISQEGLISNQTTGEGNAGDIEIKTSKLSLLTKGGINSNTGGKGDAGNIIINADTSLSINSGTISSQVLQGGEGNAGNIIIKTPNLSLLQEGKIINAMLGEGQGGDINITTSSELSLIDKSLINSNTEGNGNAGNITINSPKVFINQGALVTAFSNDLGSSGTITIDAPQEIQINNGSRLSVNTRGSGNAGIIDITTKNIKIQNDSEIAVESQGSGTGGNVDIQVGLLILDKGKINAETASSQGGNITLTIADLLVLSNNSQITARAGTSSAGKGDGGNISIDAPFIFAVPQENNDIIAKASQGRGGNINIAAEGIFGLKERSSDNDNNTNDIDASSDFGLDGTVEINTPDVDPNRGLIQLPTQPLETEVAQACTPGSSQGQSEFFMTGRGGLPPTPFETLSSDAIGVDLVTLNSDAAEGQGSRGAEVQGSGGARLKEDSSQFSVPHQIIEAQGMIVDKNGDVVLVASVPNTTSPSSWQNQPQCEGK